jgi:hypothetical protein
MEKIVHREDKKCYSHLQVKGESKLEFTMDIDELNNFLIFGIENVIN